MALQPQVRRRWKTRRKPSRRRSLFKCHKCCHTARNHFKLRRHLSKYHRHRSKVKFGMYKEKTTRKNRREVARRCKFSAVKVGKLVVMKDENLQKSPVRTRSRRVLKNVKHDTKMECDGVAGRPRRVSKLPKKFEGMVSVRSRRSPVRSVSPQEKRKLKTGRLNKKRGMKKKNFGDKRCLQPLACDLCNYMGRDSYNLRRHMQSKHEPKPPKVPKVYQCEQCEYKNKHRFLVKRHSTVHSREGGRREKSSGFPCDMCNYVSASACNLKRHQACRHQKLKEAKLQCSLCDHREPDRPALFGHFRDAHGVIIETERLEFDDYESFMEFKADTEKATFARFVRQQTRMGEKKHVIFKCHRDGVFKSKSRGERKRALKTTGSNKINSACPASMRMTIDPAGKVSVVFTKTHVGHSNEVCRLTLTKEEKILIAEMLESKRTFQEILCEIRNGMESDRLERIHLLSRKDLQNIERWYKTRDVEEPPRLSIDINIEDWVNKITQETSVVRLFKRPATILPKPYKCLEYDDFILILANDLQLAMLRQYGNDCICIDNSFDNAQVKLTTMMVLDDAHRAFPCAYMLSSKIDKVIMRVFLNVVKKESGCPMTPAILISDIPDYRRTEWSAVMEVVDSTEVLYSPWSVEDDLRRNANKIKNELEREDAYNAVRDLILAKSTTVIPQLIVKTAVFLEGNPGTQMFGRYFKSKLAGTAKKWAFAFRNRLHADSSESLESTHDILKFFYLEGQKTQKLEDCICMLMTCSRDQLQDRIIFCERICSENTEELGGPGNLVDSIARRHEDADNMKTRPADSGVYEIMENNMQCRCGLRCFKCDVCIHSYRCTCSDSTLGWTVCRHIHFCVISNPVDQDANVTLVSHPFDPLEEKRKLLLEFENMCDDIAAEEDSVDGTVVEVPVIEEFPKGEQAEQDVHVQQPPPPQPPPPPLQQGQQPHSPSHEPQELEEARNKLKWRFQSICQQMSSDVDVSLIEQALTSIENALASRQTSFKSET